MNLGKDNSGDGRGGPPIEPTNPPQHSARRSVGSGGRGHWNESAGHSHPLRSRVGSTPSYHARGGRTGTSFHYRGSRGERGRVLVSVGADPNGRVTAAGSETETGGTPAPLLQGEGAPALSGR